MRSTLPCAATRALAMAAATALALSLSGCIKGGPKPEAPLTGPGGEVSVEPAGVPIQPAETVPDLPAQPALGPLVAAPPNGAAPWAPSPGLIKDDVAFVASELVGEAADDMWDQGAGVGAFGLADGAAKWTLDYADPSFGVPKDVRPYDFTPSIALADAETLAVFATWVICPGDECTGEEEESFILATLDAATGAVRGATSGTGPVPSLVAAKEGVVIYALDWDNLVAVPASDPSAEPIWQAEAFETGPETVLDQAIYTREGWLQIATGEPADYAVVLDDYESYLILDDGKVVVTDNGESGEPADHRVALLDAATGEAVWETPVPISESEAELVLPTASTIVLGLEGDMPDEEFMEESDDESAEDVLQAPPSRTVALSRADGSIAWQVDGRSASLANDNWVFVDTSSLADRWTIVSAETGAEVAEVPIAANVITSVVLAKDFAYVVGDGGAPAAEGDPAELAAGAIPIELKGLALTGEQAGQSAWTLGLGSPSARVTSEWGPLMLVYDDTGEFRAVGQPVG